MNIVSDLGRVQGDLGAAPVVHVVDDEPAIRESTALLLNLEGYHVIEHASAEELLATAELRSAGCILLDMRMLQHVEPDPERTVSLL